MHRQIVRLGITALALSTVLLGSSAYAQQSWFRQALTRIFGDPGSGNRPISRGEGACLMSFVHTSATNQPTATSVLARKPIFTWVGSASKITVKSRWEEKDIWEESKSIPGSQKIQFNGNKSLGPEVDYIVYLHSSATGQTSKTESRETQGITFYFALLSDANFQRHQRELHRIDQMQQNPEKTALLRAEYLISHNLLFDAMQEVLSIQEPSVELQNSVVEHIRELTSKHDLKTDEQKLSSASLALQLALSIQKPSPEIQRLKSELAEQVCPTNQPNKVSPESQKNSPKESTPIPSNTYNPDTTVPEYDN